MEKFKLYHLSSSFKWAITTYFFLVTLGFGMAGMMSYTTYGLSHEKTVQFYLGNPAEGEAAFPKPFAYLVPTTHVHSYTMPMVFLTVWLAFQWVPIRSPLKKGIILGGTISILIYNTAPYLVRYVFPKTVVFFTVGGIGLFTFFLWPAGLVLYETWVGFKTKETHS
jgi:hypothetical protein